jgi:mannosyltransferase
VTIETQSGVERPRDLYRASIYAAAIVIIAAVLRFYHLGHENLWIDEGFSLRDAAQPSFLHETRPLYFMFLHYWLRLGVPHSEFMLRLPSAIFGTAAVGMLYLVGRRLVGSSAAVLASLFMAISVLHINHSDELRWYSLIVLLTLLSTYFLVLSLERGGARYVGTYVLFALASLLTFPLTVFTLVAQGLFTLFYVRAYRAKGVVLLALQCVALLAWAPWLHNNMQNAKGYSEGITSLVEKPNPATIAAMLGRFFLWKWYNPGAIQTAAAFGFSIFVLFLALYGLKGVRRTDTGTVFVWIWLAASMAATAAVCYGLANIWNANYLICASPAFFLLVSKGIHTFKSRYVSSTMALVVVVVTFGRLGLYFRKPVRPEWRPAVQYIQSHERAGDVIGIYDPGNRYVFSYYYHGHTPFEPMGSEALDSDRLQGWTDAKVRRLLGGFPVTGDRFWLVLCNHTIAGGFNIINYVRKHYRVLDHQNYNMVEIYLFDAKGRPVPMETLQ